MNLTDILEKIENTQVTIRHWERVAAENPSLPSVRINLMSLRDRQRKLEQEFATATSERYIDVCSYRMFNSNNQQSRLLLGMARALADFQSCYSLIYDAITSGPKTQNRLSADTVSASSFEFGYSFVGSIGIVLTLPNERLLFGETILDQAMDTLFKMAQSSSSEHIAQYAHSLGPAPIRLLYKWASDHIEAGMGADVDWRRDNEVRASLLLELPALEELRRIVAETSDEINESQTVDGELVGADMNSRSFHFVTQEGVEIRGRMADDIGSEHALELPKMYHAHIRKTTSTNFATETEAISYYLFSLSNITL